MTPPRDHDPNELARRCAEEMWKDDAASQGPSTKEGTGRAMTNSTPTLISRTAAAATPLSEGRLSALMLTHGTLEVRWYAPQGTDTQGPHDRDELYIVASGSGSFVRGDERVAFGPNDALFVAAHEVHRFEDFSPDFATWVMFYGPVGGESP